jgi:hypothetical protein
MQERLTHPKGKAPCWICCWKGWNALLIWCRNHGMNTLPISLATIKLLLNGVGVHWTTTSVNKKTARPISFAVRPTPQKILSLTYYFLIDHTKKLIDHTEILIDHTKSWLISNNVLVFYLKIVIVRSNQLFIQSILWNANIK